MNALRKSPLLLLLLLLSSTALGQGVEKPTWLGPTPPPPAELKRVVTLAPSLTDMVLALDAGPLLVGVTRYDARPEVAGLKRVGGFSDPSVEAVLSLKPQLLIVQPSPGNRRAVEKLAELGVPVLALPLTHVEEVRRGLLEVGKALGREKQAAAKVAEIDRTRKEIRARAAKQKSVRVLFVYGFEPLVVAGPGSFAHELLGDAGATNAAEKATSPYPVYSVESAIRSRPDVVIDASDTSAGKEKLAALPGLKSARWVKLPSEDLMHPGPRLAEGLEELYRLLYPASP
jgi:iron complex transport system substrate-binding protein